MADVLDNTDMGGQEVAFQTTCWTQLHDAKTVDQERQRLIMGSLVQRYWKPIYCFLRYRGASDAVAKDQTQGFFADVVLQRELFLQADPQKGKFRTFLLTALKRYVLDKHRYQRAEKRYPGEALRTLHEMDLSCLSLKSMGSSPEACFNHAWVADLLEQVMIDVKRECFRMNKQVHWQIFEARLLRPIVRREKPTPLATICKQFGIANEGQASNMLITVKRRLRKALERNLRQCGEKGGPDRAEQVKELFALLQQ